MKKTRLALLVLTVVTGLSFVNVVIAADSVKTRAGTLTITTNSDEKVLSLDSKVLFKREMGFLDIEKVFHLNDEDVALIRNSEGGSGTIDSYLFATKNGITEEFSPLDNNKVNPVQNGEKIIVDLGIEKGLRSVLTYQLGKTMIAKIKEGSNSEKQKASSDDDCNSLYNGMYVEFVKAGQCNGVPESVSGMSTEREYHSFDNKKFNLDEFQKLSKASCLKSEWVKYSEFKKLICNRAASKNIEAKAPSNPKQTTVVVTRNSVSAGEDGFSFKTTQGKQYYVSYNADDTVKGANFVDDKSKKPICLTFDAVGSDNIVAVSRGACK
jgi:hypothetical protein